ncbi:MAG: hypothetical protein ACT6T3_22375, partial [Agrobacterium sp.]|uniref:hypothetical protein n=1 Tax=Agrobacterium sp. TaxID=361 RepID=UPI00403431FE
SHGLLNIVAAPHLGEDSSYRAVESSMRSGGLHAGRIAALTSSSSTKSATSGSSSSSSSSSSRANRANYLISRGPAGRLPAGHLASHSRRHSDHRKQVERHGSQNDLNSLLRLVHQVEAGQQLPGPTALLSPGSLDLSSGNMKSVEAVAQQLQALVRHAAMVVLGGG